MSIVFLKRQPLSYPHDPVDMVVYTFINVNKIEINSKTGGYRFYKVQSSI